MNFIETPRLILRSYKEEDLLELAKINQDEKVMEFFPKHYNLEETKKFIEGQNRQMLQNGFGFFAVEEKESREFIGFVGLSKVNIGADFDGEIEIGWRIACNKWNQGIATEAAKACLNTLLKILN
jgi:ribosomal-protein-alanine N-acetyltransferase